MSRQSKWAAGAAGFALTCASAFGVAPEAMAESTVCSPIYDQVNPDLNSPRLLQKIDDYARMGIVVRALIFSKAPNAATDSSQLADYQEKLAEKCGYRDYVSFAVSEKPRLFNTQKDGKADRYITKTVLVTAEERYIDNLKDKSTPYQEDIAQLLIDIDPTKGQETATPPLSDGNESTPNIPVIPIVAIIGGLIVVGAVGARGTRHYIISKKYGVADEQLGLDLELGDATIQEAREVLSRLNDGDAAELRAALEVYEEERQGIENDREVASEQFRTEAWRPWPNLDVVEKIAQGLFDGEKNAKNLRSAASGQLQEFKGKQDQIEAKIKAFDMLLDGTKVMINTLKFNKWEVTELVSNFADLEVIQSSITESRSRGEVDAPDGMIEEYTGQLEGLHKTVSDLEVVRERTNTEIANQEPAIEEASKTVGSAMAEFAGIKQEYDVSCYQDLEGQISGLADLLEKLATIHADAVPTAGKLDYEDVQASVKFVNKFNGTLEDIKKVADDVAERSKTLLSIEQTLPDTISTIESSLDTVTAYAFEDYHDDVEDETRKAIKKFEATFGGYKTSAVSSDKPKYLELAAVGNKLAAHASSLVERARTEKVEMDQLRDDYQSGVKQAQKDYANLQVYIDENRSDVDGVVFVADIPTYEQGLTRKELRRVVGVLAGIAKKIEDAQDNARRKVRDAERQRAAILAEAERQERLREQERDADEQRQRASNQYGSGRVGNPSDLGGGYGPSNSGGSF